MNNTILEYACTPDYHGRNYIENYNIILVLLKKHQKILKIISYTENIVEWNYYNKILLNFPLIKEGHIFNEKVDVRNKKKIR